MLYWILKGFTKKGQMMTGRLGRDKNYGLVFIGELG